MAISIAADVSQAIRALSAIAGALNDFSIPLDKVYYALKTSTAARYVAELDPSGNKWAPNAESTILRYMEKRASFGRKLLGAGIRSREFRVSKKDLLAYSGKKILRDSGALQDTMTYEITSKTLIFGANPSTSKYAARMQLGSGRIPARPYIGVTPPDITAIQDIFGAYIVSSWG